MIGFLRAESPFDGAALADSVTLYVSLEGGGGRTTFAREQLRQPSAWQVRSARSVYSLVPPPGLTKLTTKAGAHFVCFEQPLALRVPQLAALPHVGVKLEPESGTSCLQSWSITFAFDTRSPPRLVAAVYDQWEW